jgi:hypothetical protein
LIFQWVRPFQNTIFSDFIITLLEELSQCPFDHLALSMQAAFGLYSINLQVFATGSDSVNVVLGIILDLLGV